MKTRSAKAKGRRACAEVRELLLKYFPVQPDDVAVTPSGVPGPDLWLSPAAQTHFNYAIEVKNVEALNFNEAWAQAESHSRATGREPLLVFRRNNTELRAVIRFETLLALLQKARSREPT